MKPLWTEIRMILSPDLVEFATALLHATGSQGVTVEEHALDTFIPPDPNAPYAGGPVVAYFEGETPEFWVQKVAEAFEDCPGLPGLADLSARTVEQEDWAEGWKQHFPPINVADELLILPTWEEIPPTPPKRLIRLDPGMAFGTGTHATTSLCLEAIVAAWRENPLKRVLDVGTGSGILAMAAAKLGCPSVLGCDIEPESCRVAAENVASNRLSGQVEITDRSLEKLPSGYDLVVANILAEENVRLADELVQRVKPGGWLVLSGVLKEKEAFLVEEFADKGLAGPGISYRDEWVCFSFKKPA